MRISVLLWRVNAMKLLKVLFLFLLIGGDFRLTPASLEAQFPKTAPKCDGRSNILFAPSSLLLDRPQFTGGTALIVCLIFILLSCFSHSLNLRERFCSCTRSLFFWKAR